MKLSRSIGFALLVGLFAMSLVGAARADGGGTSPSWSRLELGIRTGYGFPIGKATGATRLSELIAGQIPVGVNVGARIDGHLTFGLYYSYGFGFLGGYLRETCDQLEEGMSSATADVSCYVRSHRGGIQLGYQFAPSGTLDPWLAVGIGHEYLDFTLSSVSEAGPATSTIDADGMEVLHVESGLDYRLGEHFRVGPVLGFGLAAYGTFTRSCHGACGVVGSSGGDVKNGANHAWLFLGLRGVALR